MITRDCKKCGNTSIPPRYNSRTDQLDFRCLCGYQWSEPTLETKLSSTTDPIPDDDGGG